MVSVIPGRPRTAAVAGDDRAAGGQEHGRDGQEQAARAVPPLGGVLVGGPVVLEDRPQRAARPAPADGVHDVAAGLVGDPPAVGPEAPAQVHVLEEEEEPLVPAADPVQRLPAQPDRRARDPLDVAGHLGVGVELAVRAG